MAWFLPAAIAAVGAGSSALSYFSGRQQNDASDEQARAGMNFSASQAEKQMAFQERMSNTSHQREVEDLKAAGLNPMLSVNSGASSPGGSSGTGMQAPVVPELDRISSSVMDSMRMMNEFRSSKAQSDLAKSQARKAGLETELLRQKGPEAEWDQRFYKFMNGLLDRFGRSSAGDLLRPNKWKFGPMNLDKGRNDGVPMSDDDQRIYRDLGEY